MWRAPRTTQRGALSVHYLGSSFFCRLPYLLPCKKKKMSSFFLVLAALLRRREELLAASGLQLRLLLAETLSPAAMATLLVAEGDNGGESAATRSPLALWCSEAEALDVATPESFRHHLALIGEIAEAEYEVSQKSDRHV